MTDLLLKSTGPVADQYRVLAGDQVVGHVRLSEVGTFGYTLALDFGLWAAAQNRRTYTHGYGNSRGGAAVAREELAYAERPRGHP